MRHLTSLFLLFVFSPSQAATTCDGNGGKCVTETTSLELCQKAATDVKEQTKKFIKACSDLDEHVQLGLAKDEYECREFLQACEKGDRKADCPTATKDDFEKVSDKAKKRLDDFENNQVEINDLQSEIIDLQKERIQTKQEHEEQMEALEQEYETDIEDIKSKAEYTQSEAQEIQEDLNERMNEFLKEALDREKQVRLWELEQRAQTRKANELDKKQCLKRANNALRVIRNERRRKNQKQNSGGKTISYKKRDTGYYQGVYTNCLSEANKTIQQAIKEGAERLAIGNTDSEKQTAIDVQNIQKKLQSASGQAAAAVKKSQEKQLKRFNTYKRAHGRTQKAFLAQDALLAQKIMQKEQLLKSYQDKQLSLAGAPRPENQPSLLPGLEKKVAAAGERGLLDVEKSELELNCFCKKETIQTQGETTEGEGSAETQTQGETTEGEGSAETQTQDKTTDDKDSAETQTQAVDFTSSDLGSSSFITLTKAEKDKALKGENIAEKDKAQAALKKALDEKIEKEDKDKREEHKKAKEDNKRATNICKSLNRPKSTNRNNFQTGQPGTI